MQVNLPGEVLFQPQCRGVRAHPGQRSLHRFLHNLADLSSHCEAALALHLVCLNEENVAARGCPGKTHCHAGPFHTLCYLGLNAYLDAAQELLKYIAVDKQLFCLALDDATRLLSAYGANHLLQLANSSFARVVTNDMPHRLLRKFNLVNCDSVLLDLARN